MSDTNQDTQTVPDESVDSTQAAPAQDDLLKLRPGILVYLKTEVAGGVTRKHKDLPLVEKKMVEGHMESVPIVKVAAESEVKRYEATIITTDADEYKRAEKTRVTCRRLIESVCAEVTNFGLLCLKENEKALRDAKTAAYAEAAAFNATSKHSTVRIWVNMGYMVGDEEDVKRFAAEMRDIFKAMNAAITGCDADEVRAQMKRAKALSAMLQGSHAARATAAIEQARKAANEIAETIRKRGESAEGFIIAAHTDAIREAEKLFLDFAPPEVVPDVESTPAGVDLDGVEALPQAAAPDGTPMPAATPSDLVEKVGPEELPGADDPSLVNPDDVDASAAVDADVDSYLDSLAASPDDPV